MNPIMPFAELSRKISTVLHRRMQSAQRHYIDRLQAAMNEYGENVQAAMRSPLDLWKGWFDYATDFTQRSLLFWDTLRQRGNNYLEHERAGKPPVLHFEYETVLDARKFERPVNYVLLRITPPAGVHTDEKRRPYVVIDPRAGHGPGIGGFKDDSQVGVALRAGHPVYFVSFFPDPEPGQTLLDVCAAEARFVREVHKLHPNSPKPVIIGNCQGGWAAMMLAASNPDDTGPVVINGAPMSYWSGAWKDGEGDNPMRYAGGLLGGTWLASLASDLGNGRFDGAWLVQNFENLNPANTFWDKYYHLFANVDKEPPRFLEFERWWGGFFLMNREEIEWITENLFVGNRLWSGDVPGSSGNALDLRNIKVPIVLFASMGDNITPPQQAFNWVADVYGSTDEIKARGQVIVGLVHESIGHLGIFVSGRVAKKEHAQLVSVLKSIEALPPGLWAMQIHEKRGADGKPAYDVDFSERTLEEVVARTNQFQRVDERPFRAAADVSEFNRRMYETFLQPIVRATSSDFLAEMARQFHPLRFTRWALSDMNPMMGWLAPAAKAVSANRRRIEADHALRAAEQIASEAVSASFDFYRDARDALSEAAFFSIYGSLFLLNPEGELEPGERHAAAQEVDPRQLPSVQDALRDIDRGGYAEAVARAGFLLRRKNEPLPVSRLQLLQELVDEYRELLPDVPDDEWRRIRGRQEIIARHEPQRALKAIPRLLADPKDRRRFLGLIDRLLHDPRIQADGLTPSQKDVFRQLQEMLEARVAHA